MKIKVCGMRDEENIRQVVALAPDFIGFIFSKESPRYVGPEFVIPFGLSTNVRRVGVFVNTPLNEMTEKIYKHRLDYVQLHGDESHHLCREIRQKDIGVIKVFAIDDDFDFDDVVPFVPFVNYFLFDTKGKQRGGNGQAFNWNKLYQYKHAVPFFVSGGISPFNIAAAKELSFPKLAGLDLNSGFEFAPGLKNVEVLKSVIKKS